MSNVYNRLYRRGAIWHGFYYDKDGRRVRISTRCTQQRAAAVVLARAELQGQGGTLVGGVRYSLRAALESFLNAASVELAEGTVSMYRKKGGHLIRLLGENTDLTLLTLDKVRGYIAERLTEGAARSTVSKELVTLRQTLEHAHEEGLFRRLPAEVVPTFRFKYAPRKRWLTPEQSLELIRALPKKRRLWVLLGVLAGPRLGEIERLRWEDVDFVNKVMTVPGTKTEGSLRTVPMTAVLVEVLRKFRRPNGKVVERWCNVQRDLARHCRRTKLPRVSPNDLRRTFASWLKQKGTDSLVVAHLLGHTTTRMVELVYGQLSRKEYRDAVDSLPTLDNDVAA